MGKQSKTSSKDLSDIPPRPAKEFHKHDQNCSICVKSCPVCFIYDANMRPGENPLNNKVENEDDSGEVSSDGNHSGMMADGSPLSGLPKLATSSGNSSNSGLGSQPTNSTTTVDRFKSSFKLQKLDHCVIEAGNDLITKESTEARHKILLHSLCRLCGGLAIKCREKEHFGEQIDRLCGINPKNDDPNVHPKSVCSLCCKKFYYRSSHVRPSAQFRSPIDLKKFNEMRIAIDCKATKEHMKRERESDKASEKDNRMRSPTVLSTGIPSNVLQAQKAAERQTLQNNNRTKSPLGTNNDSFLGGGGAGLNNPCQSPL